MTTGRDLGKTRLPIWAAGFVILTCFAILGLSGWREWETRNAELRNAEIDVANLAHSLIQHADDTFELVDTILVGLVHRLELDGTGSGHDRKASGLSADTKIIGPHPRHLRL